jgi:hypothetical protein
MKDWSDLSPEEIIDYAVSPIMVMSTEHFTQLHREIGYQGSYSIELKLASRQFSERALPSIGLSTPQMTVTPDSFNEEELLLAWQVLLLELQNSNLKTDVCEWLIKLKTDQTQFGGIVGSNWADVLVDWAIDIENSPSMAIAEHKIKDFKIGVMKKWITDALFKIHEKPELAEIIKVDVWENYIINIRTQKNWLSNRKRLYQAIAFWVQICNLLSNEELYLLDKWGYSVMQEKYRFMSNYFYFSVVQLADNFRTRGYLEPNT